MNHGPRSATKLSFDLRGTVEPKHGVTAPKHDILYLCLGSTKWFHMGLGMWNRWNKKCSEVKRPLSIDDSSRKGYSISSTAIFTPWLKLNQEKITIIGSRTM